MKNKIRIGLIYGGRSPEHDISVQSAAQIKRFLDTKKYQVTRILISKEGVWPKSISLAQLPQKIDLAFIAMHGSGGEDGAMQGFLETLGIPYTCSGVFASSIAMDKFRCGQLLAANAVRVPESLLITKYQFSKDKQGTLRDVRHFGSKLIVKPNRSGSSVGVQKIANKPEAVTAALKIAFAFDSEAVVQRCIDGREVTVPLLGNQKPKVLPVVEIKPAKQSLFFDYAAKYEDGGAEHIIPAKLPKGVVRELEQASLLAHMTLGCRGVSRSDFIIADSGTVYYLETNTIPGMTPTSLLPQSAAHAGLNFPKLLDAIISLAL